MKVIRHTTNGNHRNS